MEKNEKMSQNQLSIYHSLISVCILFITISLIQQSTKYNFLYALLFLIIKSLVDIVFHKLGYSFRGFGIKKMLIANLIILFFFVIWSVFY
ncbi:hypothetical protein AN957_03100 [Cytobacillus solani]|uniref:Cytochrome C oxidase subunit IV n=1 Tax=Cytobacillus solani TaxID=1637975 RepID=A0A0Q3QJF8_9BACI|nr:hypothetical protein AN957_03100 [Cytobacillus solani]